jgi:DNA-binding NtrC family response regulator
MGASHEVAEHSPFASSVSSASGAAIKPTVLVVEDETFVRNAACAILEGAGYVVLAARNAAEAKNLLGDHSESVGILFSDVVLPGQNGCELADEIKAEYPGMQTILTSGYPCEADEDSCYNGVFYLPKPFSADGLLRKMRQVTAHTSKSKPV